MLGHQTMDHVGELLEGGTSTRMQQCLLKAWLRIPSSIVSMLPSCPHWGGLLCYRIFISFEF